MVNKIYAFIIYNVYSFFFIEAFRKNTPFLLDSKLVEDIRKYNLGYDTDELGWGDHYIWRLFAAIMVTWAVSFLTGAIAKEKPGKTAIIANIPSVLVWLVILYFLIFTDIQIEGKTGYIVISILAIPLTSTIAYFSAIAGEEESSSINYDENKVFNIHRYHFIWLIIPLYVYSIGFVNVAARYLAVQFVLWGNEGIISTLISLIALTPVIIWYLPIAGVFGVLSGGIIKDKHALLKTLLNFGMITIGIPVAMLVQYGCYWILRTIAKI
jgi:hypothetical protein